MDGSPVRDFSSLWNSDDPQSGEYCARLNPNGMFSANFCNFTRRYACSRGTLYRFKYIYTNPYTVVLLSCTIFKISTNVHWTQAHVRTEQRAQTAFVVMSVSVQMSGLVLTAPMVSDFNINCSQNMLSPI